MQSGWSIQSDDVSIVGAVVLVTALIALVLQRSFKWPSYPYWIVVAGLVAGILVNNWLGHALQPRF